MKRMIIAGLGMAICLTSCSAEQRAEMEGEKLAQFELTSDQTEVANALIEGYKKDTGMSLLRSQDYARAACYAKTVNMPSRFYRVHLLYLKNYTEADSNWEGFFARNNADVNAAYDMGQVFQKGYDKCSTGALIKKALQKNN